MANSVSMRAPVGWTGGISVNVSTPPTSGQTYTPDANGMVLVDPRDVMYLLGQGFLMSSFPVTQKIATADNGTTQTLTAAMVAGASEVIHVSTGGTTPSLTLPLAADVIAALPGLAVGGTYILRVINSNSGTATIVTNTGWTTSGTLTIATNTWRDFLVRKTSDSALTITSIGTGTNS